MKRCHLLRRRVLTSLSSAVSIALIAPAALGDLTGDFADTLVVDPGYVTGANGATDIAFSGDRAVITTKSGAVFVRRADGTKNQLTGLFDNVDTGSEKGLLGVVSDPEDPTTLFFYVSNGETDDKHRVYRGTLGENDEITIDAQPIVAAAMNNGPGLEGPANHDGGGLFIHEGQLYIGVGDTGANATPPTNKYGSCLNKGNGKILRVELDGSIPADNPLTGVSEVTACDSTRGDFITAAPDERIFAWGFRNPWRFWIDPHTDLMWIGDVGEATREEISVGTGDQHYGYPFFEGARDWSMDAGELRLGIDCSEGFAPSRPCVAPVHDYDHNGGNASVTGGLIPEGCGWTNAFDGRLLYLFADYNLNWVHALEVAADRSGVVSADAIEVGSFEGAPVSIRQGPDQAVYMVFYSGGAVYRFAPAELTGPDCSGSSGGTGGGAGAANGGSAGGGAQAGAGAANGGSGGGSGGSAGKGGSGGASGGGGAGAAAGAGGNGASSSGESGMSGTGGGDAPEDDDGCGCSIPGASATLGYAGVSLASLLLAGGALLRRRRRR
jgi:glucose/arabinose dehydrogenase